MAQAPVTIEVIEDNTEVTMTFTNVLYKRLQNLIFKGLPFKDYKHFMEVVGQVQQGEYKDPLAYHLATCLHISALFEEGAKAQGKLVKKSYNPDTKEVTVV